MSLSTHSECACSCFSYITGTTSSRLLPDNIMRITINATQPLSEGVLKLSMKQAGREKNTFVAFL